MCRKRGSQKALSDLSLAIADGEQRKACGHLGGDIVDNQTNLIIWEKPSTDGQHSLYQLLQRGTKLIPCDII
jgi:glucose-6-phosphate isomerase